MKQSVAKAEQSKGDAYAATFRPTPADTLLLRSLAYKRSYFARKGMLASDGSFFYDDERLAKENLITSKTVGRSKRRLQVAGKIKFEPGRCNGRASRYWVLVKEDELYPFAGFDASLKLDSLSVKPEREVEVAGREGTPNINNNLKNIKPAGWEVMTEEQERERRDAFRKCIQDLKRKHGVGTKTSV